MISHKLDHDITVLADHLDIPTLGCLPVNCFVLGGSEPVVVDTGLGLADRNFLASLSTVIDPSAVRWIWLTHPDRDHTGGLFDLLEAAPQAKVVTTFLAMGIMSTQTPLPLERVHLLNPGETLDVVDRHLSAIRPPLFDSPATVGFIDDRSGALFSSDCFGAPMPNAAAAECEDISALVFSELRDMQLLWATIDAPWVHMIDVDRYRQTLRMVRDMNPSAIFSSHLPPAYGQTSAFLDMLAAAPSAEPWVGPDQFALDEMLASMAAPATAAEAPL